MTIIVIDIETIGCEDPAVIAEITAHISPPRNISRAESFAKWRAEQLPCLIDDAVKKTSFYGALGRIICVGLAVDNEPAECFDAFEEKTLLAQAFARIKDASTTHAFARLKTASTANFKLAGDHDVDNVVFVGHNLVGFDLRFLWQRAVIHGLKPPLSLLRAMQAKPWDKCIADTMLMWSPERELRISLDKLCKALGVPTSKGDIDGPKVWQAFKDGRLREIAAYCKADVEATRECYKRMIFS